MDIIFFKNKLPIPFDCNLLVTAIRFKFKLSLTFLTLFFFNNIRSNLRTESNILKSVITLSFVNKDRKILILRLLNSVIKYLCYFAVIAYAKISLLSCKTNSFKKFDL